MKISNKKRTDKILEILSTTYPDVKTQLDYENPFQLLIATILSAQCTDKQVNKVTQVLFSKLSLPMDFVKADINVIEHLIRPTGYYRNKARNIRNCSGMLVERFQSRVPETIEELVQLPGVGRKTANVVLSTVFGKPGIVVDTHVARISKRLRLTCHSNPVKIEKDLMEIIPVENWRSFCLQLIYFGRSICKARKPGCPICPVEYLCSFNGKTPPNSNEKRN